VSCFARIPAEPLIRTIGIPLFEGTQGGNGDAQRNAIAISDLQIKVAELQRGRAQLLPSR
jgi:hypothetical protein